MFVLCRMWFRGLFGHLDSSQELPLEQNLWFNYCIISHQRGEVSDFFPFIYKTGDFGHNVLRVLCDAIETTEVMGKKINSKALFLSLIKETCKQGRLNELKPSCWLRIVFYSILCWTLPETLWILLINMSKNVKYIMPKCSLSCWDSQSFWTELQKVFELKINLRSCSKIIFPTYCRWSRCDTRQLYAA